MRMRMYSVLDKAVQVFNPPVFFRAEGEALRSFTEAVSDPKSQMYKYRVDYAFAFVGFYDDSTASFEPCPPLVVAEAATVAGPPSGVSSAPLDGLLS